MAKREEHRRGGFLGALDGSSFLSSLMAIAVGLLVGFVILLASNPAQALLGFRMILLGGVSDMKNVGQVLYLATPIIMTGLSVGFANKTGLFNIGGSGQFIVGAYAAIFIGVKWTFLPAGLHWIAALLGAVLAGGLWGLLPGILKAYRNVNEVISCIMMNYIGMYGVNLLITRTVYNSVKNQTKPVAATATLPKLGMDRLFVAGASASSVNSGILIAVLLGVVVYIVVNKTKLGFELKACGFNRDASRYAGINEKRGVVLSMVIAGALSGLGGALLYLGGSGKYISVVDTLAAEGFNGIPVALLGLNHPIGIIFAGLFIAYLNVGGFNMQLYNFVPQVIEIITAVIIYFSAFSLLLRGMLQQRRLRREEERLAGSAAGRQAAATGRDDGGGQDGIPPQDGAAGPKGGGQA